MTMGLRWCPTPPVVDKTVARLAAFIHDQYPSLVHYPLLCWLRVLGLRPFMRSRILPNPPVRVSAFIRGWMRS